jgi:outer membrane lipoprotein SlyB
MKSQLFCVMVFLQSLVLFSGCQTADRAYEGATGTVAPDKMDLQTRLRWKVPPSQMGLRPVATDKMSVYLRYKNSGGVRVEGLHEQIREQLRHANYEITNDIDDAHFYMLVDVRYFGQNRRGDRGGSALSGAVVGGATGAVIGNNTGDGNAATGAAVGAAAGGILGGIMGNRNKMVEIDLLVDVSIGERVGEDAVRTERSTESETKLSHYDAEQIGGAGEAGRSESTSSERQSVKRSEDFLYHDNRVVVFAKRMNLTPQEALTALKPRLSAALSSVLP